MASLHDAHSNGTVITPPFIDQFIEVLPDGQGLVADIKRILEHIEKRAGSGGLVSTYFCGEMMWYAATMDLRGSDPIAELGLGIQNGGKPLEMAKPYKQTSEGAWQSIEKATPPLPREFWPLSIEYVAFEALRNKRESFSGEQANVVYHAPQNGRHLTRK